MFCSPPPPAKKRVIGKCIYSNIIQPSQPQEQSLFECWGSISSYDLGQVTLFLVSYFPLCKLEIESHSLLELSEIKVCKVSPCVCFKEYTGEFINVVITLI